jgi:uncharacterized protein
VSEGLGELGLGIGWRPELALAIDRHPGLGFVELTAENHDAAGPLPEPVVQLMARGVRVVVHGVSLSLGGAAPPGPARLEALARLARATAAPLVSEHVAFVRAGGMEAGHLLPVPRTPESLELLVENVLAARLALPAPLALENIAAVVEWPDGGMGEAELLAELLERTGSLLLLDVSNVHANARNHGLDPMAYLDALPLHRLAYAHVGGGVERDGVYHDTHAHRVDRASLELLEEVASRVEVPGAMLERDDDFPPPEELAAELEAIRDAARRGTARRLAGARAPSPISPSPISPSPPEGEGRGGGVRSGDSDMTREHRAS